MHNLKEQKLLKSSEFLSKLIFLGKSRVGLWIIIRVEFGRDRRIDFLTPIEH